MEDQSACHPATHSLGRNIVIWARNAFQALLRTSASPNRLMWIEEQMPIGPKKTLMLINCGGRRFLFATATDAITPLIEVKPLPGTDLP